MLAIDFTLQTTSSTGRGVADHSLKDHDNLSWLYEVDPRSRADWRRRLQWVKLVDRLAEEALLHGDTETLAHHVGVPRHPAEFGVSWCEAWQNYVVAVNRYYQPKTIVPSLEAHQEMLLELSGNIFCLFPEVDWSIRRSIAHFGALDQFFSNLRDLNEDAEQNLCHFPLDVLTRFGLTPQDIANKSCLSKPAYLGILHFCLDDYLPRLRMEAAEFAQLQGLPRALRLMRACCLRRHERIERLFRESGFDFVRADSAYWSEVDRELVSGVRQDSEPSSSPARMWRENQGPAFFAG